MIIDDLRKLFNRDLNKLRVEISSYRTEENLWKVDKAISNAAGNLCLHLIGNLNAYLGTELGSTGYVRDRDLEFSQKNIPKEQLVKMIDDTMAMTDSVLSKLPAESLGKIYPVKVLQAETTTGYFLIHLAMHLGYHLGQINYHRRLLD